MEDRRFDDDPYVQSVLRRVPLDVQSTLTIEQWDGFRKALEEKERPRHAVDVRFEIPLYFARYYFVMLLGKDRRVRSQRVLVERRSRAKRFAAAVFIASAAAVICLGALFFLYLAKCGADINLFKNSHLMD